MTMIIYRDMDYEDDYDYNYNHFHVRRSRTGKASKNQINISNRPS